MPSWTKLEPFAHSQDKIQCALADVTIFLDASDWFDIKEPIHNVIRVDMPVKASQQYRQMEKEMFLDLNGEGIEVPNAAAKTVKCLQIASGTGVHQRRRELTRTARREAARAG